MNILEKLGIYQTPWEYKHEEITVPNSMIGEYTVIHESVFTNDGERFIRLTDSTDASLIATAPEMLEALIEWADDGIFDGIAHHERIISIIEKATGKTWEEIRELIK